MQELTARAALVSAPDVSGGLTTTLARRDVEEALRADEPPELLLEVTRSAGEGNTADTRNVAVSWKREDLERLLQQASGESVQLTFDRGALEQAMQDDVEAHGLREKALTLAVAVTVAAGAAASASGMPLDATSGSGFMPIGGGGTPAAAVVSPDDRAVSFAAPTAEASLSPDDRAVSFQAPAAPEASLSPDSRAVSFASPTAPDSIVSPDDRAVARATPVDTGPGLSPDDRALPRSAPGSAPTTAAPASDDGVSITAPSPEAIAVGGAVVLAITGAAFAFAANRRMRPA